ncbi:6-O-methylguanine DNA methyltransferase [Candidatus Cerribacteria bacterium 'Amazon FNV 2010 28 9']|uniref:6-O-methylguanine DNA methyltransferase n=1 Tax=Candidatus Cerribacteria bacterium 'Amazon FNV 2010 28 9' TaxID=2081795 RepID=A0A317JRL6_9BACT|nr:MAG: 6-O-methylguanine DNA methyltransferase [Candidatus Cerribacteria bacterium 'Amazon FNV 2010 28 9']
MTFREQAWECIREIPKGKVATYGQIARRIGNPDAARAVGLAMKMNPDAPRTPCHRVVASDGSLHGYSAGDGIPTKKKMLQAEGVVFVGDKVNLSISQWKP